MKKLTSIFILFALTLSFLVAADNLNATFTLQSAVRGLVVHGFLEGVDVNFSVENLFQLIFPSDWDPEEMSPGDDIFFSKNLSLGPEDIKDFDFGEGTYKDVASYAFVSNSLTGVSVNFTITDFVHTEFDDFTVPWELNVKETIWSSNMTVSPGKKASGSTSHPILSTLNTKILRWAYINFDLVFAEGLMPVAGNYVATVTATVIAQ